IKISIGIIAVYCPHIATGDFNAGLALLCHATPPSLYTLEYFSAFGLFQHGHQIISEILLELVAKRGSGMRPPRLSV
ncbi:hypothetical protein, partial [Salipiger bermudensis]|uniref:hypothetical protein n=1 Tax=Salipiger bermudensis TaxID=344736 RepID=UPI003513AB07